ncbi:tRNA (adenosine(37)-N6)-threonylcarbamoyltransferase complex ATPase subunit type 1 TsaE [Gulosibacter bifidus]|uniref:tRNA threonylcarbamoyladenosine biosynthesis protein TsaE n=1 Tax=Gulosibacter bifidus TaxID=272239 RepID=A0ABW5RIJ2_9MICO|nr:tRNA (adenosine(37)-N6)-threonylcarbamoyltransferase complex ATPase subunit type 1 TsaE [Gulosibacter bifidus]
MTEQQHTTTAPHTVATADGMHELGRRLGAVGRAGDVIVLTGPLGAGKTTLVRGLGEALGIRGAVSSPTFVIARTHPSLGAGPALIHVDAYRLSSALELDDLDLDLDASVTVIEWGHEVVSAITDHWLEVTISRVSGADAVGADEFDGSEEVEDLDDPRQVTITAVGARWQDLDAAALLAGLAS